MKMTSGCQYFALLSLFCFGAIQADEKTEAKRPNILFIAADDLRPQFNCYGRSEMITPNIDALADRGMVFERAYAHASRELHSEE